MAKFPWEVSPQPTASAEDKNIYSEYQKAASYGVKPSGGAKLPLLPIYINRKYNYLDPNSGQVIQADSNDEAQAGYKQGLSDYYGVNKTALSNQGASAALPSIPSDRSSTTLDQKIKQAMVDTDKFFTSSSGEKIDQKPQALVTNTVNNALDIVKGLPSLGKAAMDISGNTRGINSILGKQTDPFLEATTAVNLGKGLLQNLAQTTGVNKNTIGVGQDGKFYWNPEQQIKDAFVHDYNHPVDTSLWILPFLKEVKGTSGILGQAAEDAPSINDALANSTDVNVLPEISSKAGKAATSIVPTHMESVVKAEELMGKALQITGEDPERGIPAANSIYDIAKRLPEVVSDQGKVIDDWAALKDQTIGPQPLDEVVNQVMSKVKQTASAKANPQLLPAIEDDLKAQLNAGQLEGGMATGNPDGTNFSAINKSRKYMTSGLNSWFNNGQPVGTPTNDLNAMRWAAANGLKEVMAEADNNGTVASALDKQHIALQTEPLFSAEALKEQPHTTPLSARGLLFKSIRSIWTKATGGFTESMKIQDARSLQGSYVPPVPNQPPTLPNIQSNPVPIGNALPAIPTTSDPSTPEVINTNPENGKKLIRDMRYKQGNPQFK